MRKPTQGWSPCRPPRSTNLASFSLAANRPSEAPHELVSRRPAFHPFADGFSQLFNLAFEEMIDAFNDDKFLLARQSLHQRHEFLHVAKFIVRPVHKQFRLRTFLQIRKIRVVHRRANSNQAFDPLVFTSDAQSYPTSETETSNDQWHV